ncbi:MAG: pyridoxamine 5'-phosphate oxidase family protein [Planctomycetota bacterium]
MNLSDYFEKNEGTGILATCDPGRHVDQAIYSKPFVVDENTVAFVMKQRISHQNLRRLPRACYVFLEKGPGYKGVRMHLTVQREEKNRSLIKALRKKQPCIYPESDDSDKFLVFFEVDQIRPLVGNELPA